MKNQTIINEIVAELGDSRNAYQWWEGTMKHEGDTTSFVYEFSGDGSAYRVEIAVDSAAKYTAPKSGKEGLVAYVKFFADGDESMRRTNKGNPLRVMATIMQIVKDFVSEIDTHFGPRVEQIFGKPLVGIGYEAARDKNKRGRNQRKLLYQAFTDALGVKPTRETPDTALFALEDLPSSLL
jgi:hypothetical protein